MYGYKRLVLLIFVMAFVSVLVAAIAIGTLYSAAFDEERARLTDTARSQARLMESVARFNRQHLDDFPGGADAATLQQIEDAHRQYSGFGETGGFAFARREGDNIIFLHGHRAGLERSQPVPFDSHLAEPMRRALRDERGTLIGPDYLGTGVLAAYEPVAELNMGIVAKIDVAEVRAPFIRAALAAAGAGLVVVVLGAVFFVGLTNPVIRRLQRTEHELTRLAAIVESSSDAIVGKDLDGTIQSWNDAAEQIYGYSRDEALGKPISIIVPPDRHDEVATILERIRRGERVEHFETVRLCKDGRAIDVWLAVSPINDHTGWIVGASTIERDITDRKEAEESLRESERMFRALFEQAGGYCMLLRPTDNGIPDILDVNEAACNAHGYTRSEMLGRPAADLDDEEGKRLCRERTNTIMSGKTLTIQTNHMRKDGSVFPVEVVAKRVQVAGKPPIIMTTEHDITERKQAEQALRDREERLRAILNAAVDSIITIDRQGIINGVNSATEQMFGYTQDELVGQNVKMLMPPPFCEEHDGYLARYLETGEAQIIGIGREVAGKRKDGSTFPVDLSVSDVEHLGLFTGIIRDITDRKETQEALRREHEFSESLTNTARNIVLVLDTRGRIIRFNPYMEELTGWRLDEVEGQDWFDTFIPDHDRTRIRELFGKATSGERVHGNVSAIVTKDGHEREIEWYSAPLTDVGGKQIGLLATGLDVTERRMLEREVLEIAAEEQRRIGQELHDGTQQQLTGLGLISQNVAETLQKLAQADEAGGVLDRLQELHQKATQVQTGLEQAAGEVNQLSRGLIPVELDAQGLMSSLTELARSVSDVQGVNCTFVSDGAIEVPDNFTATHLYRVAQEAVNNALKHSRGDRIEVSLSELNNLITLKVLDNGNGMDEKRANGPGMGLRIMAYRADLIGATVQVGPAEEGGTQVSCTISRGA
jgi:PAS domain S-box-containing protein